MKVVIAGTRTLNDIDLVAYCVGSSGFDITEIVSGGARGIDRMGELYGDGSGIEWKRFKAKWGLYGNSAGPIRNRQMSEYCDAACIIWDGKSPGTLNMIQNMERVKKPYNLHRTDQLQLEFEQMYTFTDAQQRAALQANGWTRLNKGWAKGHSHPTYPLDRDAAFKMLVRDKNLG